MSAQTRSEIVDLLERHGLTPVHRLGQHFLADGNVTRKIVAVANVKEGSKVVEIGAGTGTLTKALAQAGARVVAYEVDLGLRPVLEEETRGMDVTLRFTDVASVDLELDLDDEGWSMVSNLPYNVGTPVLLTALRTAPSIVRFVVMVQKEVAHRLTASVGDEAYGVPSVIAALYTSASIAFTVPPQVFYPQPNVESSVVVMERVTEPVGAEKAVELARAGFGQRRKMLRRSLSTVVDDPSELLESVGIDPTSRAEDLTHEDFLRLAGAVS
ncbi:MAG: 16S rRNA (adenine(1518)-N(6)/adenine(1519)-N(6))-dimethyltransferase RsmA [Acidimicrobiia bacterium]|nr:16S rRNA (adenine(1518)-N(6)/adenine(1519)-N(6))-dimethyltransferase RsmA [Acidimicrobiia bacterium]